MPKTPQFYVFTGLILTPYNMTPFLGYIDVGDEILFGKFEMLFKMLVNEFSRF